MSQEKANAERRISKPTRRRVVKKTVQVPYDAFFHEGFKAERAGDLPKAADSYEAAIREKPDLALAWYNYGDALLAMKRIDSAIEALRHAVQLAPETALYSYDLGLALYDTGRYAEAKKFFAPIVAQDAKLKRASSNLGLAAMTNLALCELELGNPKEGVKVLEPTQKTAAELLYNFGKLNYHGKHLGRSLTLVQAAALLQPKSEDIMHLLGDIFIDLKRNNEAQTALESATKLNPRCAYAWYDLGVARANLKQGKKARLAFVKARKIAPGYPSIYYGLACLDALEQKNDAAFKNLEVALRLGYKDIKHMRVDTDLRELHRDRRWKELLSRTAQQIAVAQTELRVDSDIPQHKMFFAQGTTAEEIAEVVLKEAKRRFSDGNGKS